MRLEAEHGLVGRRHGLKNSSGAVVGSWRSILAARFGEHGLGWCGVAAVVMMRSEPPVSLMVDTGLASGLGSNVGGGGFSSFSLLSHLLHISFPSHFLLQSRRQLARGGAARRHREDAAVQIGALRSGARERDLAGLRLMMGDLRSFG